MKLEKLRTILNTGLRLEDQYSRLEIENGYDEESDTLHLVGGTGIINVDVFIEEYEK